MHTGQHSTPCATCPAGVPVERWQQAVVDAERFLSEWGNGAEGFGWPVADLFGLHPVAPMARYDVMGLRWVLHGKAVVLLTETEARLSDGLTFRHPPVARLPGVEADR
jgi:hypothetical protein